MVDSWSDGAMEASSGSVHWLFGLLIQSTKASIGGTIDPARLKCPAALMQAADSGRHGVRDGVLRRPREWLGSIFWHHILTHSHTTRPRCWVVRILSRSGCVVRERLVRLADEPRTRLFKLIHNKSLAANAHAAPKVCSATSPRTSSGLAMEASWLEMMIAIGCC